MIGLLNCVSIERQGGTAPNQGSGYVQYVPPYSRHAMVPRGCLAKIFDPNLRIYSLLEDEPRLRYRKNIAIEELWLSCFAYYTVLPEGGMMQERR